MTRCVTRLEMLEFDDYNRSWSEAAFIREAQFVDVQNLTTPCPPSRCILCLSIYSFFLYIFNSFYSITLCNNEARSELLLRCF